MAVPTCRHSRPDQPRPRRRSVRDGKRCFDGMYVGVEASAATTKGGTVLVHVEGARRILSPSPPSSSCSQASSVSSGTALRCRRRRRLRLGGLSLPHILVVRRTKRTNLKLKKGTVCASSF